MYLIRFIFFIFIINQLNQVLGSWKKPILNETKIFDNNEIYSRLIKQILTTNQNLKEKDNNKEASVPKFYPKLLNSSRTISNPKLLVIALDGFRYDYVDLYNARSFKKILQRGVYAKEGLIPSFLTKTFPNFFGISTGLYQEKHGIIDNFFRDQKTNKTFDVYSKETHQDGSWYKLGEPIWLTASRQGKTIGSCQYPSTDPFVELLSEFIPYNPAMNFSERLDISYDWLFKKDLDLVLTYYHQPDDIGHYHGPFSKQIQQEINIIDNELSKFIDRLDSTTDLDQFNVLFISDHGMSIAKDLNYKIFLSDYIDVSDIEVINEGAVAQINAKPERIDEIFEKLKYSSQRFRIYRKEDLPKRLHYGYLNHLYPLILISDEGYQVFKDKESRIYYIGNHGWDNELYSMRPLFYGYGSNLKRNYNTKSFETINLYNLMCKLLDLKPAVNDGKLSLIEPLLI